MSSNVKLEKKSLKGSKNAKKKKQESQPSIQLPTKTIMLKYVLGGICASLKNSQQVVPGNTRLSHRIEQLSGSIATLQAVAAGVKDVAKQDVIMKQMKRIVQDREEMYERLKQGEDRVRKNWLIQCDRYKRWLEKVTPAMRIWMDDMMAAHEITFPMAHIKLRILFYFPNLNRRDGPNKEQAIFDMLKLIKVVPDDAWTVIDDCHWTAKLNRGKPRTEIYITMRSQHVSLWSKYQVQKTRAGSHGKGRKELME